LASLTAARVSNLQPASSRFPVASSHSNPEHRTKCARATSRRSHSLLLCSNTLRSDSSSSELGQDSTSPSASNTSITNTGAFDTLVRAAACERVFSLSGRSSTYARMLLNSMATTSLLRFPFYRVHLVEGRLRGYVIRCLGQVFESDLGLTRCTVRSVAFWLFVGSCSETGFSQQCAVAQSVGTTAAIVPSALNFILSMHVSRWFPSPPGIDQR